MSSRWSRYSVLVGLATSLAWPACSERDHGNLAKGSSGGASSATGGKAAFPSGGFGAALVSAGGRAGGGAAGRAPDEPPGKNALTLVHGIVDVERVRVCFYAGPPEDGRYVEPGAEITELHYGNVFTLSEVADVDLAMEDLVPVVITGDLSRLDELDCEDAVDLARLEQEQTTPDLSESDGHGGAGGTANTGAGTGIGGDSPMEAGTAGAPAEPSPDVDPSKLRVVELPAIARGTLTSGRSLLFVMTGCMGGPETTGSFTQLACGGNFTENRPTLSAILVPMSRTTRAGRLGMQVLHASTTAARVDLQSSTPNAPLLIQGGVDPGALMPRAARTDLPVKEWYVGLPGFNAQALLDGRVLLTEAWEDVLERSGLASVEDGKNYVAILLGPHLETPGKGFWNRPAIALVASEPE